MKIRLCFTALLFAIAVSPFPSVSAGPPQASCPAGQAIQSVDFAKHTVTCVPLPQSDALRVVDNDGQLVGMLLDASPAQTMARQFGNRWYRFQANGEGFVDTPGDTVLVYESTDCTGTGYVLAFPSEQLLPDGQNVGTGASTTFYIGTPGTETVINALSTRRIHSVDPGGFCTTEPVPVNLPVEVAMQVTVNTTLPWRVTD